MNTPYSQRQALFARKMGEMLVWLFDNGYEATVGDFYATSGHMANSVHGERMAADLNIYLAGRWMDGKDMTWQAPHWDKIAKQWESLDPLCRAGANFKSRDYNHFSVTPDGKRA